MRGLVAPLALLADNSSLIKDPVAGPLPISSALVTSRPSSQQRVHERMSHILPGEHHPHFGHAHGRVLPPSGSYAGGGGSSIGDMLRWFGESRSNETVNDYCPMPPKDAYSFPGDSLNLVLLVIAGCLLVAELLFGGRVVRALRACSAVPETTAATVSDDKEQQKEEQQDAYKSAAERLPLRMRVLAQVLLVINMFTQEMYYGMLIPFMPCEASNRGISQAIVGFIVGSHAVGALCGALLAPHVLARVNPAQAMRRNLIITTVVSSVVGVAGSIDDPAPFAVLLIFLRILFGFVTGINDCLSQAIGFSLFSTETIPKVVGFTMMFRLIATCGSPSVGGAIYEAGGWGLPFFCSSILLLLVVPGFYLFEASFPGFSKPREETITLGQLLCIKDVIFLMFTFIANMGVMYSFEPLYEPVLTADPYNLSVGEVGTSFLVFWGSVIVSVPLIASWLYHFIGTLTQQGLGFCIHTFGVLLQGPSPILAGFVTKSLAQVYVGMSVTGLGMAFSFPMQSLFMLQIIKVNTGITKEDCGAAIASAQIAFGMLAGAVGPPIGGALYDASGFPGVSTAYGIFGASLYVILFIRLIPYGEGPKWWKARNRNELEDAKRKEESKKGSEAL